MKRKFIFLAMMLLTLMGGVNLNVLNAQEIAYRIKVADNSNNGNVGVNQYLHINNHDQHPNGAKGGVGISDYAEDNNQIFTIENTDNGFYLRSVDGYYIFGQKWNVDAFLTTTDAATELTKEDLNDGMFYLKRNSQYFKVGKVDEEDEYAPYCDADKSIAAKWVLEPVVDNVTPAAPTNLTATKATHNSVTLSWTAGTDALLYNVYRDGNKIAKISGTTYKDEGDNVQAETTYKYTVESVHYSNVSTTHSNEVSVTTLEMPATQDIIVGDGDSESAYLPVDLYYGQTLSQQIYTSEQLGFTAGTISKIAFNQRTDDTKDRIIDIYMINTEKDKFETGADWVQMKEEYKVYSGQHKFRSGWNELILDNSFEYDGTNILICFDDNTKGYTGYRYFKTNNTTSTTAIYHRSDNTDYNPLNPNYQGTILYQNNQIKFTVELKPQVPTVNVNTENIAFETPIRGGSYWTERAGVQPIEVVITPKNGAEVTNIELVNNSFFSIPANIDFTANPITFNVSTGVPNEAGTKTATLRITHTAEGETIDIPVTAEVYMAAQGDAIENPFEVEFTENTYSNTVDFTTLYDDYTIKGEAGQTWQEGNNPDAVYKFTLTENALVTTNVSASHWMAIYNADFNSQGGPKADNHIYTWLNNQMLSAGTYYVVIAANEAFTFTLTKTAIPAPIVTYYNPYNNAVNQVNPMLEWGMEYAEEYQLLLGTAKDAMEVVVDWTKDLATSYQTVDLQNNTQYFWQVNAKGEGGETTGKVYSFVTLLNVPAITSATAVNLYPGEATTIAWEAVEGASEYNIYVNGNKVATTAETSYELSGLAYNMTGHNVTVSATHTLGESLQSEAVVVKVAGSFPLVVSVKDANGNPIEGATVTIDMTKAYDEFKNQVAAVEAMTTNAKGTDTITLPVLGGYAQYGSSMYDFSPYYLIKVSKYPYFESTTSTYYYSISNGNTYTSEHTLYLPTIASVSFDNEEVITVGSDIVLKWSDYGVEEATAYNVYKKPYGGVETLVETVTTNELTITAEHDNVGSKYGVSAVFGDIETSIKYTSSDVYVLGNGSFSGYVTDGTSPIANLTFKLAGTNAIGEDVVPLTTNAEGKFEGEVLEGNNYTLTISHYDYEAVVMQGIEINYNESNDLGTIVLTAKPSVKDITVTATDNGEYANVTWTGSYEKYNVYRRNIADLQDVELLGEATTAEYADNEWAELEDGTYQYGVSAFVEEQAQSRGVEVIFEEGFETNAYPIPNEWDRYRTGAANNWVVKNVCQHSSSYSAATGNYAIFSDGAWGDGDAYLTTKGINISGESKLTFKYITPSWGGDTQHLIIHIIDNNSSENEVFKNFNHQGTWKEEIIDLSSYSGQTIKIKFTCVNNYGYCAAIDDIVITGEVSSAVESQIVWSNNLTKQSPATFEGTVSTDWNTEDNWSTGDVPDDGADVIINANAVISSEVNVKNIDVKAELTIDNGGILTVTNKFEQANFYNVVLVEGGQIFQKNEGITARFKMDIENPSNWKTAKDGWQFISMPMTDVYYSDFTSLGEHDLYKYDGSKENEWLNYKEGNDFEEGSFKSGYGYLATLKDVTTATVYGTLNVANPFAYRTFSYVVEDEQVKELSRIHLVGNPFTYDIKWSDFNIIGNVYNIDTDEVEEKQLFVNGFAVANGGGYKYYDPNEENSDATIKVGQGFFVKILENGASLSYQPNTRSSKEKANSINVIASGKAGKDNVVVNFAGQAEGFNKLQNFNDAIATVYVTENGKNYGIANVDENTTEVALNFDAKEMGNYTISLDVNGEFETVTLVDRFTGVETNMLLEDEYTFTATSNDNVNRFVIRLANSQEPTANSQFVYQSGEELILSIEGSVQIVDMLGRVVYYNEHANGDNRINVAEFNDAAYVVRVVNEEGVKTQKVVIY